ncbi:MAG: hypothetical protein QM773_00860 [Hyphomonadaceae bacterium]
MSLARYTYLAWLRRGAANAITAAATIKSRAEIKVSLALSDGAVTGAPIEKSFKLQGPGDVIGISGDMVVRTEPRHWVTDFEPNYLPFIEFYDEDFPWRHTPAPADLAAHRLTPWISLLVLAEGEFTRNQAPGRPLTSVLVTSPDLPSFFPPPDQVWAWAHVQIAGDVGGTSAPDPTQLGVRLAASPDSAVSRLVSPRRLEKNTAYTAFVVPTFEAGRKAGLGLPINDDAEPGMALSWSSGANEFPIYQEWYFQTGEGGDFEDLVQRIAPRQVDKRVGVRDMDIAAPGFGMPQIAEAIGPGEPPGHHKGVVGLEGALKAPDMTPKPLDPQAGFASDAARVVNAPADAQASHVSDPVVAPPLTGGWHALLDRVDPAQRPAWTHDLNLDPRQRAAGGLGARVVRKHQERYMKLAWEQVGEIVAANRKAGFLRFSQAVMQMAFSKSVSPLQGMSALSIASPMLSRVLGSPRTIRALVSESRMPSAAMTPAFRKLTRPRGLVMKRALPADQRRHATGAFAAALNDKRVSAAPEPPPVTGPTFGQVADGIDASQKNQKLLLGWLWLIIAALLALAVAAYLMVGGPAGTAVAGLLGAMAAGVVVAAQRARPALAAAAKLRLEDLSPASIPEAPPANFVLSEPGKTAAAANDPVAAHEYGVALRDLAGLLAAKPPPATVKARFDENNAYLKVMKAIAPAASYSKRAASLIRIGDYSIIDYVHEASPGGPPPPADPAAPPAIKPVMAYPDIKEPMYRPLADINDDLLAPNIGLIPPNTVTLLLTNPPFIEAYLAGVNHEFARELLWREYPTDCRGTPFRQFWDVSRVPTPGLEGKERARKLKDIEAMHLWPAANLLGRNPNPLRGISGETVVLALRGDLLKRYPNTIVYAQRARWSSDPAHANELALYDEEGAKALTGVEDPNIEYPIFTAAVAPDLTFVGFKLTLEQARGDPALDETAAARASVAADKLGWFFVLQEALGEPRFGLDEHAPPASMTTGVMWDNLSWDHINVEGRKTIDLARPFTSNLSGSHPTPKLNWAPAAGATAADLAAILYQKPVMVAWHARQMLERGKV